MKVILMLGLMFLIPPSWADDYSDLLPAFALKDAENVLRHVSFDQRPLMKAPAVLFVSGQSFSSKGENVLNKIQFFEGKDLDVWLMRQQKAGFGFHFANWDSLAIVVDHRPVPSRAYYFQFQKGKIAKGTLPRIGSYSAACFKCHSSGPRVIRPRMDTRWLAGLSERDRHLIDRWNQRIANYRVVDNYIPAIQKAMLPNDPRSWEPLMLPACVQCHSPRSGVRGPLLRLHGASIEALVDHAQNTDGYYVPVDFSPEAYMPMQGPRLSPVERHCLLAWIDSKKDIMCNARGEVVAGSRTTRLVDGIRSRVQARAVTQVSAIDVAGFLLSGSLDCERQLDQKAEICHGEIVADLRRLSTGIALRDRHLSQYLKIETNPTATVRLEGLELVSDESHEKEQIVDARVTVAGVTSPYRVKILCRREGDDSRCRLRELQIQIDRHAIATPSFLGLAVDRNIQVNGEIVFRAPGDSSDLRALARNGQ